MAVFARIDHGAGAASVGLQLRSTQLLIFGNARAGTPLMQADQIVGIDLPLKALVYEDETGRTWIAYNNPAWIAGRHGLGASSDQIVAVMAAAVAAVTSTAAQAS